MSDLDGIYPPNVGDAELPSGVVATIRIPRPAEYVIAGGIPLGSLEKLEKAATNTNGKAPDLDVDEIAAAQRFNDAIVKISVTALNGKPVTLTDDDLARIPADDLAKIVAYAMRAEPLPKVEAPS